MGKGRDRTVYLRSKGKWVNQCNDSRRATGVHPTQLEAIREARGNLIAEGGGVLTIIGADRRIRSRDTISPGNDPFLP